jgi:hypothetical protein
MSKMTRFGKSHYYLVTIRSGSTRALLGSNNERAFMIAQLQELLNARSILEDPQNYRALAHHIDLLAFSLLPYTIQFVLFAISPESVSRLCNSLLDRLFTYQDTQLLRASSVPFTHIHPLRGPHDALHATIRLHLSHPDWEYDRYSSIGFYLHDRRGSWMRLWRLTHLYDNQPEHYLQLMLARPLVT